MLIKNISNIQKKFFLVISDIVIIVLSISLSYSLRLEQIYPIWKIDIIIYLIFLTIFFGVFYIHNIYQILIRYFDYYSAVKIFKSIFVCFCIIVPVNFLLYENFYFPRSISFIAPAIVGILITFHRIFLNFLINSDQKNNKSDNNIIIFGINQNNVNLIKSIRNYSNYGNVKGLIDTSGKYKKRELNGIKIFKTENLNEVIEKYIITEIIIGHNSLGKNKLKDLFNSLENKNIRIRNLFNTKNYLNKLINQSFESEVNFFDIVNRPKIKVEKHILKKKIYNKIIMVTGGGGSIGSELCLEILKHNPKKLFILEISEINLFNLIKKINQKDKNIVEPVLGDCSDELFLENTFRNINFDEIYHAAAYKHVHFGEENPYSMIKNNIFGTKKIIEFAYNNKIGNFTFISSDKAVNPKSILGFTKKIGEKLLNEFYLKSNNKSKLKFSVVRFGNVIGSSGSVIPIFLEQLKNKIPLTVTNKKTERYFMSISEAVQLVINSSYLNKNGFNIYALNMGKQIKIYEIAKRIIRLSGYTLKNSNNLKGDIKIKFIGLKRGEKISEELTLGKNLVSTDHKDIMKCNDIINSKNILKDLKILEKMLKLNTPYKNYLKSLIK